MEKVQVSHTKIMQLRQLQWITRGDAIEKMHMEFLILRLRKEGAKQWIEESRPKDKERATPKSYCSCSSSFNIPECLFIARGEFLRILAHKCRDQRYCGRLRSP